MLTLQEVKDFLKIEYQEEDVFISSLVISSEIFIKNSTHKEADETTELFKLSQLFLIAHWFENRSLIGKNENLGFHLESLLNQITYTTESTLIIDPETSPTGTITISQVEGLQAILDGIPNISNLTIDNIQGLRTEIEKIGNLESQINTKADSTHTHLEIQDFETRISSLESKPEPAPYDDTLLKEQISNKLDAAETGIHLTGKSAYDIMFTTTDGTEGGIFGGTDSLDIWWKDKYIAIRNDGIYTVKDSQETKLATELTTSNHETRIATLETAPAPAAPVMARAILRNWTQTFNLAQNAAAGVIKPDIADVDNTGIFKSTNPANKMITFEKDGWYEISFSCNINAASKGQSFEATLTHNASTGSNKQTSTLGMQTEIAGLLEFQSPIFMLRTQVTKGDYLYFNITNRDAASIAISSFRYYIRQFA